MIKYKTIKKAFSSCFLILLPLFSMQNEQCINKEELVALLSKDIAYYNNRKTPTDSRYWKMRIEGTEDLIKCLKKQDLSCISTKDIMDCSTQCLQISVLCPLRAEAYNDVQESLETLQENLKQNPTIK